MSPASPTPAARVAPLGSGSSVTWARLPKDVLSEPVWIAGVHHTSLRELGHWPLVSAAPPPAGHRTGPRRGRWGVGGISLGRDRDPGVTSAELTVCHLVLDSGSSKQPQGPGVGEREGREGSLPSPGSEGLGNNAVPPCLASQAPGVCMDSTASALGCDRRGGARTHWPVICETWRLGRGREEGFSAPLHDGILGPELRAAPQWEVCPHSAVHQSRATTPASSQWPGYSLEAWPLRPEEQGVSRRSWELGGACVLTCSPPCLHCPHALC